MKEDFKLVPPITITSLWSSSPANLAPETPPSAYNAGTNYSAGTQVSVANGFAQDVYQSLVGSNIGNAPASSPNHWFYVASAYSLYSATTGYVAGSIVTNTTTHRLLEATEESASSTVTITIANPGVVTWSNHGLDNNDTVVITTDGALPTGLTAGTTYYVRNKTATTFELSTTSGGSSINTSGSQSGTHTAYTNYGKALTDAVFWLDIGPTNRWAMFDASNGTATTMNTSGTNMRVVVVPTAGQGRVDTIGLQGVSAQQVRVQVNATTGVPPGGGTEIYDETFSMKDVSYVRGWHDWFTGRRRYKDTLTVDEIPFRGVEFVLTFSNLDNTGEVSVGNCQFGRAHRFGVAVYGATVSIDDYSDTQEDGFGGLTVVERPYAKTGDFTVIVKGDSAEEVQGRTDYIHRTLSQYRATPCLYIGTGFYGSATIFGYYRNFDLGLDQYQQTTLKINIRGLT